MPGSADEGRAVEAFRRMATTFRGMLWEGDEESHALTFISDPMARLLEGPRDEALNGPAYWRTHLHPEDHEANLRALRSVLATGHPDRIEYRFRVAGGYRWFEDHVERVASNEAGPYTLVGVTVESPAPHRDAGGGPPLSVDASVLLASLAEGGFCIDRQHRITSWNAAAERLTGFSADEAIGRQCSSIISHVDASGARLCGTAQCPFAAVLGGTARHAGTGWLRRRDGATPSVSFETAPVTSPTGAVVGAVQVFSRATPETPNDPVHDPLTGLLTRSSLEAVLAVRHADLVRHRLGYGFAFVDINRVDDVGQDGPAATDTIIRLVASRLRRSVREGDVLGRWARGTFGIVVGHVDQPRLVRFGNRLSESVGVVSARGNPGVVHARIVVGLSLGTASRGPGAVVADASVALMDARRTGRRTCVFASPPSSLPGRVLRGGHSRP